MHIIDPEMTAHKRQLSVLPICRHNTYNDGVGRNGVVFIDFDQDILLYIGIRSFQFYRFIPDIITLSFELQPHDGFGRIVGRMVFIKESQGVFGVFKGHTASLTLTGLIPVAIGNLPGFSHQRIAIVFAYSL